MPIDASIYGQIKPFQAPSPLEAAQGAMALSQMGMQQQQMQYQMQTRRALMDAYALNTGPDGSLDRQGFLSQIGKTAPMEAPAITQQFAAQDKAQAEARSAQSAAAHAHLSLVIPAYQYLLGLPDDQAGQAYHGIVKQLADQGVPVQGAEPDFDRAKIQQEVAIGSKLKEQLDAQAAQAGIGETQAKTGKTLGETAEIPGRMAKTAAETAKLQSETYARPTPTALGQTDDPAKLVPYYVPKDHQAKAFEEIKNAQDIKNLTPQIMAAFQKGSSRNPNTAAQGQREFEGLINTTVKETEGTARQAAFDSIHNTMTPSGLTALPGENAAKARTVMEYLQSKSAAPTARGYGIDLAKFAKTSPYQAPADQTAQSSGLGGSVANASTSANTKTAPQNTAGGFSLSEIEAELGRRKGKGK